MTNQTALIILAIVIAAILFGLGFVVQWLYIGALILLIVILIQYIKKK